jgi:hydroxymethylglutaryl-CoA reductase
MSSNTKSPDNKADSAIPAFYKLSVPERVRAVRDKGFLNSQDFKSLLSGEHTLSLQNADRMIENVVGILGMPVGLAPNFRINGKDYVVPLAVEEPSIVAALSSAAKIARKAGGYTVESTDPLLIGQIQVVEVPHTSRARLKLLERKQEVLNLANSLHPRMVARGGGAKDLEVILHPASDSNMEMLVVHLLVDTRDAMGANLVNTMCEGVASLIEGISGGRVFLRILSNLTDRALVKGSVCIPPGLLAGRGFEGESVRDGIIIASQFAAIDPYRAATHNKGIMNGVDAVALATGNDWRAIEAAAHAYAARGSRYTSLTRWYADADGNLVGEIDIPMKVGIVGGPLQTNPTVALNLRMLNVNRATELAEVMGIVGLAQNFSALRALATDGIQQGHMTLHARSVATAAGATPDIFPVVVDRLVESGEIKIWKAQEIIKGLSAPMATEDPSQAELAHLDLAAGHGKIILLGEHAVVYGSHAIAAAVPLAVRARVQDGEDGVQLIVPRWGVEQRLHRDADKRQSFERPAGVILEKLGLLEKPMRIEVYSDIPRAMGLGGSAAVAVAIIRALDRHYKLGLSDDEVNNLAFECERVAHGTPSGVDNTVATFGKAMVYQRNRSPTFTDLEIGAPMRFVIGMTGIESLTAGMVARVRKAWENNKRVYNRVFKGVDGLTLQAIDAIRKGDHEQLGDLMNVCQGLLNSLRVSSWELEELIHLARDNGALGAKLTGGGGGGSMIALCTDNSERVIQAIRAAGYQATEVVVE